MLKLSIIFSFLLLSVLRLDVQSPRRVSPKLFYSLTQKHPKAMIFDVRPSEKYAQYRIEGAIPLPEKKQLLDVAKELPRTDTIFIYCEFESRTGRVGEILDSLGFKTVYELKGGLISWRRNGLPLDNTQLKK
ncbi:rhodanese-like domain-containing protein [Carboxylicivirga sp. A043]|uniref:rhodanese-like domain-containing protein n=1 Tax=Carboxylicivirga litoralis TaxID=2816963 RepID=UPI0021CAE5B9|nr:rhodanese-like domain-containing protein [Carboxylicivirga sp. A043]MCU4155940.1 rhodanese-like domain-containing protein [Carboxylicivirga sp. A043]